MLDIPALFSVVPARTRFVAKRELFRIPLFGQAIRLLGFVPVDREDRRAAVKALDDAAELAREKRPILVFPEGTRSLDGRLLPFKKGAFALAHRCRLPVVPMACLGGAYCMPARRRIVRPGRMLVRVGRVLGPDDPAHATRASLMRAVEIEIGRLCEAPEPEPSAQPA
jgi:1-acyl-sn-glycerol-3-phosphate acyltransferase